MRLPLYLFAIFAALDVFLTAHALENWNATEINPIANWLYSSFGWYGLLGGKMVLASLIGLQLKHDPIVAKWTLWVCAIVQIVVVAFTLLVNRNVFLS